MKKERNSSVVKDHADRRAERAKSRIGAEIDELLLPDFLVLCEDYVCGVNNSISIIKTVDFLCPSEVPFTPEKLVVIATFFRLPFVPVKTFSELKPELRLVVHTPTGKRVEIGIFPVSNLASDSPWLVERLIVDLSGAIEFTSRGAYRIEVEGRTNGLEFKPLHWRLLPVAQSTRMRKLLAQA